MLHWSAQYGQCVEARKATASMVALRAEQGACPVPSSNQPWKHAMLEPEIFTNVGLAAAHRQNGATPRSSRGARGDPGDSAQAFVDRFVAAKDTDEHFRWKIHRPRCRRA
jgi:hypothetical protein